MCHIANGLRGSSNCPGAHGPSGAASLGCTEGFIQSTLVCEGSTQRSNVRGFSTTQRAQSSGEARALSCTTPGRRLSLPCPFPQPCFIYRTPPGFCSGWGGALPAAASVTSQPRFPPQGWRPILCAERGHALQEKAVCGDVIKGCIINACVQGLHVSEVSSVLGFPVLCSWVFNSTGGFKSGRNMSGKWSTLSSHQSQRATNKAEEHRRAVVCSSPVYRVRWRATCLLQRHHCPMCLSWSWCIGL